MIIAKVRTGDVIFVIDNIGLPDLVVVRLPVILSIETNLSIVGTIPISLTVILFLDIATIAFLTITIATIVFLMIVITTIIFLMVAFSTVAFLAINPLPFVCIFIDLVSKETISIVVAI